MKSKINRLLLLSVAMGLSLAPFAAFAQSTLAQLGHIYTAPQYINCASPREHAPVVCNGIKSHALEPIPNSVAAEGRYRFSYAYAYQGRPDTVYPIYVYTNTHDGGITLSVMPIDPAAVAAMSNVVHNAWQKNAGWPTCGSEDVTTSASDCPFHVPYGK